MANVMKKVFNMRIVKLIQKEYQQTKTLWLPFQQNPCHCSLKTFAKSGRYDSQICCPTIFDFLAYFDENQQESICCKKPLSYTNCNVIDC